MLTESRMEIFKKRSLLCNVALLHPLRSNSITEITSNTALEAHYSVF